MALRFHGIIVPDSSRRKCMECGDSIKKNERAFEMLFSGGSYGSLAGGAFHMHCFKLIIKNIPGVYIKQLPKLNDTNFLKIT